jgi:23S rRNA (adenine-N6)-dimethyltransferase
VVEFGAGRGVLTAEIARRAAHVLAVEIDRTLTAGLARRFASVPGVTILLADAREVPLPVTPYRVLANLPFQVTAAVLRRLLDDPAGGLQRADLVVQWQVARARARSSPGPPTDLLGASWGPWWELRRGRRLPAGLFRPPPSVDAALLVVTRRAQPLLPSAQVRRYTSFVRQAFDRTRIERSVSDSPNKRTAQRALRALGITARTEARDLSVDQWVRLFRDLAPSRSPGARQAAESARARRRISAE